MLSDRIIKTAGRNEGSLKCTKGLLEIGLGERIFIPGKCGCKEQEREIKRDIHKKVLFQIRNDSKN
jgi:hypothetical protein